MSFQPLTDPVDYILLGGVRSPGLADVEKGNSPRAWAERIGYGLSGATTIFRGVRLSHFAVRFRLYTNLDWAQWPSFAAMMAKPPLGERPRQLEIWHPILEDLGITACGVEDIKQPVQIADGVWQHEVLFIEYRKLQPALSRPDGARAAPVDPIDQHIEALAAQVQALSAL